MMSPKRVLELLAFAALLGHAAAAADFAIDPSRLNKSAVLYRDQAQLTDFPLPVVSTRRAGLSAGPQEITEIKEKILYPLIENSRKALSAIVFEWYPGQPNALGVLVLWSDGETRESMVARTVQGNYDAKAYEIFFAKPTP
jgi:hypothetical protein